MIAPVQALVAFEQQWKENALVMDKWFGVQVRSPLPGAVGRATVLMKHAGFTFTNPNKLRAVVGAFARGNPQQFHDVDGSGYSFLGTLALGALSWTRRRHYMCTTCHRHQTCHCH